MQVDWNPPEPRAGLAGQWDRFMGPGLRPAEFWLILLPSLLMTIGVILYASAQNLGWTAVQTLVAAIITFDLTGGVITNATSTAKRWYHRSGQGVKEHLGFTAVHFIHLLLVAWLFRGGDWLYLTVTYGYLLVTAVFIARATGAATAVGHAVLDGRSAAQSVRLHTHARAGMVAALLLC